MGVGLAGINGLGEIAKLHILESENESNLLLSAVNPADAANESIELVPPSHIEQK